MKSCLFELQQIEFGYPNQPVLRGVDLQLHDGERIALVGDNGAGKSSLLRLLVGLNRHSRGELIAFGKRRQSEADFRQVRARAGLLFQDPDDQLFCPTVLEDVAFGPLNLGKSRQQALAIAERVLTDLGLDGFAERITHKLSGGEKRLVSLATILAMEPQVLLLDEPTNALDARAERQFSAYLQQLPQAMLFTSHDRHFVERLATRAVLLDQGRLQPATLHSHPHVHRHDHRHIHAPGFAEHRHPHPPAADVDPKPR